METKETTTPSPSPDGQAALGRETVYTVSSTDDVEMETLDRFTLGSWRSREEAVRACADYILERMERRADVRYAVLRDENHPEVRPRWPRQQRRDFLVRELDAAGCYVAYSARIGSFRFDVDANPLV